MFRLILQHYRALTVVMVLVLKQSLTEFLCERHFWFTLTCTKIAECEFQWSDNTVKSVRVNVICGALLHKQVCSVCFAEIVPNKITVSTKSGCGMKLESPHLYICKSEFENLLVQIKVTLTFLWWWICICINRHSSSNFWLTNVIHAR